MQRAVFLAGFLALQAAGAAAQQCEPKPVFETPGRHTAHLASGHPYLLVDTRPDVTHELNVDFIDLVARRSVRKVQGQAGPASANGRMAYLYGHPGHPVVEIASGRTVWTVNWIDQQVSPQVNYVMTRDVDYSASPNVYRAVQIYAIGDGRLAWRQPTSVRMEAHYSRREGAVVLAGQGVDAIVVDLVAAREVARLRVEGQVVQADVSPDLRFAVTSDRQNVVTLWDIASKQAIARYPHIPYGSPTLRPVFLADGRLLLPMRAENNVYAPGGIVDLAQPETVRPLPGFTAALLSDDRLIIKRENRAEVIDSRTLAVLASFPLGLQTSLVATPGGKLVVAGENGSYATHSTATGAETCRFGVAGRLREVTDTHVLFDEDQYGKHIYRVIALLDPETTRAASAQIAATSAALTPQQKAEAQRLLAQGYELLQAGQTEGAIVGFRKGLAIDPANGLGHFYLAEAYGALGRKGEARDHYRKVIEFAPASKEALVAEAKLGAP